MSTTAILLLVIAVVVVVLAVAVAIASWTRGRRLRERFGNEYDRTIDLRGSKRKADHELTARAERHDQLHIASLSPEARTRFRSRWEAAQTRFVDEPTGAAADADRLVKEVMAERGYPVGDFDQRAADLSVEHADVIDHYREANSIAARNERGEASTEDLRQAMVHYRALFTDLLRDGMPVS